MKNKAPLAVAVLTVSDRCSRGEAEDKSGPRLRIAVESQGWRVDETGLVPDDVAAIQNQLRSWCDTGALALVLTTGGTGLGPRDVTPQATRAILDKELPGLVEFVRSEGRKLNPLAVLSQAVIGIRNKTLIINLPGSPQGAEESFRILMNIIPHAVHVMSGGDHAVRGSLS
jgi:molybdopterin adenylyltransferase